MVTGLTVAGNAVPAAENDSTSLIAVLAAPTESTSGAFPCGLICLATTWSSEAAVA